MLPVAAFANNGGGDVVGDEIDFTRYLTIQFESDATAAERAHARNSVDGNYEGSLAAPGLQQITIPDGESPGEAARTLENQPGVEFVTVAKTWSIAADPEPYFDDPFLPKQWALLNYGQVFLTDVSTNPPLEVSGTPGADINAPGAWAAAEAAGIAMADPVEVGVIDTGVAYQHEDLAVSVVPGQDFFDDDSDPRDPNGHGTHVASVLAGTAGNGAGIAGANPWARVVPLRAAGEDGVFEWPAIEQAVTYGLSHGVKVFNGSFGGPDSNPAFDSIMEAHPEALFVFSAGNGGSDSTGDDHDAASGLNHRYPCDSSLPNVICVGATQWEDKLTGFSDYGVKSVDITAPGSRIFAARPCDSIENTSACPEMPEDPEGGMGLTGGPGAYQLLSGTSMAAPQVTATAALIWGAYPDLHSSQVKGAILKHTDAIGAISAKIAYGGRLDADKAMAAAAAVTDVGAIDWPTPPPQPTNPGPDDGDDGGGIVPPKPGGGADGGGSTKPLTFTIIRPRIARIGRSTRVKFKLRCSAVCSSQFTVRPNVVGLKSFKGKLKRGNAGTRAVVVKIPSGRLKSLRALLNEGISPKLNFSVVVRDNTGAKSAPVVFSVKLAK